MTPILTILSALALQAPAAPPKTPAPMEFAHLEITYTLGPDGSLTERRDGEIEFNGPPPPERFRGLLLPLLNREGSLRLPRLVTVDSQGTESALDAGEPVRIGSILQWGLPHVEEGQRIRFSTEQKVDLSTKAGAWWFSDSTMVPLPVRRGTLVLRHPPDFSGSIAILDSERHTAGSDFKSWSLDESPISDGKAHFAVSGFKDWREFSDWAGSLCDGFDPDTLGKTTVSPPNGPPPDAKARRLAKELSFRLRVHPPGDRRIRYTCRPGGEVARTGSANLLEAQAALWSVFLAHGLKAERLLSGENPGSRRVVNPVAFGRALVAVRLNGRSLYFDVARLVEGGRLDGDAAKELALPIGGLSVAWESPLPAAETGTPERVEATLEATIDILGTLRANFNLSADGPASQTYRNLFRIQSQRSAIADVLGPFLRERAVRSGPVITDPNDGGRPFQLKIPFREPDFLLPIQRRESFQFNVIPLAPIVTQLEDGRLWLGTPGVHSEVITVRLPEGFATHADFRVEEDRDFAVYSSEARSGQDGLRIVRSLVIRESVVEPGDSGDLETLVQLVEEDQGRLFLVRRLGPAHLEEWIESIPGYQTQEMAFKAHDLMEYEVALRFFERAKEAIPEEEFSWSDFGSTLGELGRRQEALEAFKHQIRLHPEDKYAYFNLAFEQTQLGQHEEALENLLKQLEVDPGNRHGLANLPYAYMTLGRFAEAEKAFTEAARIRGDEKLSIYAGVMRVCQGLVPRPGEVIDALIGPDPDNVRRTIVALGLTNCGKELDLAQAQVSAVLGALDSEEPWTAGDTIHLILNRQANLGASLHLLGRILAKKGRLEEASELYRNLLRMANHPEIFSQAAEVEWRLGRVDSALQLWREATFLAPGVRSSLPPEAESQIERFPTLSEDGLWYPLQVWEDGKIPEDAPIYFFVTTKPDGSVQSARPLDRTDPRDPDLLPAIRQLPFPEVRVRGKLIPTAHLVKCVRNSGGAITVLRSSSPTAGVIVSAISPQDFPAPE